MTIGERVYHKTAGVCILQDVRKLERNGEDYCILSPCYEISSTLYVPLSRAEALLRPVMNKEDALQLIASLPDLEPLCFSSSNERKQQSAIILKSGDSTKLAQLSKTFYNVQNSSLNIRGNYSNAQNNLRQIEKLLFGELASALGIDRDKVPEYIRQQLAQ